ncbi:MAG: 2-oxo acid dehydrogenase subunit E2 [Ignavibacteriae bacterium]|nr:2-oxo acid dehydrogenase subunit E2 [Ignavibacteriota bacterium]
MKVNIIMPKMGESINEGTIIKWYKQVGDKVKKDEIIYEISTDKVDTEIPSPSDGTLIEIKAFENETVPINEIVAVIETNGESEAIIENKSDNHSTDQVGSIIELPMPKMGESINEGTIIKWHKNVGDAVKIDEIIYEISTDKVDTEVPSPVDGVITEILFKVNDVVEVGNIVARISTKTGITKIADKETIREDVSIDNDNSQIERKSAQKTHTNSFISPVVMQIANKEGVTHSELNSISGTGINGRITKKDILDYIKTKGTVTTVSAPKIFTQKNISTKEEDEIVPMDNIRKKIMEHMISSRDTSVHVSEMMEIDMTKIHNFIDKNREKFQREENIKLTYLSFIADAAIRALNEFPLVNSSIEGENIILKNNINLGIAVALEPNGLVVPNIKNADEKNVRGLAKSISEISVKARNKGLTPDDIIGGTFTITNYGVFGALFGTPIINQPEVAILGVGAVVKKPVVIEVDGIDTIAIKPMMYLTLSHDHRLVDGMLGGMFLKYIKDTLENYDVSKV